MEKRNEILELSFEFALQVIEYCELLEEKRKYVIARQLLKSGTSIGANVREAQNAESNQDFIHKLKIAAKEADELQSNHEYHNNIQFMSKRNIGCYYVKNHQVIQYQQI